VKSKQITWSIEPGATGTSPFAGPGILGLALATAARACARVHAGAAAAPAVVAARQAAATITAAARHLTTREG
jgi:hypothetical protein